MDCPHCHASTVPAARYCCMCGFRLSVDDVSAEEAPNEILEERVRSRTIELSQANERLRAAQAMAHVGHFNWQMDSDRLEWSDEFFRIHGLHPHADPLHFDRYLTLIHPDDRERAQEFFAVLIQADEPVIQSGEYRILDPTTGQIRWLTTQCQLRIAPNGTRTLEGISQEITQRKQIEQSLRLTQFGMDRAADSFFWIEPTGRIIYVNDAACRTLGYARDELIGKTVPQIDPNFPPDAWPAHWEELRERGSFTFESDHATKNGGSVQTEVTVNFIRHEGQEFNFAIMRDISERKRAEKLRAEMELELRRSEERFSTLFYASPFSIMVATFPAGEIVYANGAFLELFQYTRADVIGRTTSEINLWANLADRSVMIDLLKREGRVRNVEFSFWTKEKERRTVLLLIEIIEFAGVKHSLAMSIDITDRKQAEGERRQSEERYRRLFETISDSILVLDTSGRICDANPAAAAMHGYTHEELLAMNIRDLDEPGDALRVTERIAHLLSKGSHSFDVIHRRKDGSSFPMEVVAVRMTIGSSHFILGLHRDISDRKQSEQQANLLREELAHASRLGILGEMAAGLAHELNQPLAAINLSATAAINLMSQNSTASLEQVLRRISEQSLRAGEIVRRMRNFIRRGPTERVSCDMNELIRDVLQMLDTDLRHQSVRVTLELAPDLPLVSVDAIQVQQVLVNLIRNAVDAIADAQSDQREIRIWTERERERIRVRISDTGPGLDTRIASKLFEPFQTTKASGLGLGLTICRTLIESHGGQIQIDPETSAGTTFSFRLPIDTDQSVP